MTRSGGASADTATGRAVRRSWRRDDREGNVEMSSDVTVSLDNLGALPLTDDRYRGRVVRLPERGTVLVVERDPTVRLVLRPDACARVMRAASVGPYNLRITLDRLVTDGFLMPVPDDAEHGAETYKLTIPGDPATEHGDGR